MSDLNLKTFDKLYPMIIHKYDELFDDQNANIMDRINTIVNYLNQVGKLTNDVVKDWNVVYQWVMNDGLTTDVNNKIEAMKANGELDTVLQSVFNSIAGDKTTLHTTAKDTLVAAINEVDDLAVSNQTQLAQIASDNAISPEKFTGTDYQKVQQALDYAIINDVAVKFAKIYDITGQGSLKINKADANSSVNRKMLYLIGVGGGIKKLDGGFIFDIGNTPETGLLATLTGDITVQSLKYYGQQGTGCIVWNADKIIRVNSSNCKYDHIDQVFSAPNTYAQSMRFNKEHITDGTGWKFEAKLFLDTTIENCLNENGSNFLRNTVGTGAIQNTGLRIKDNVVENLSGLAIQLGTCFNTVISGNHMELNGGYIDLSTLNTYGQYGLTLQNNYFNESSSQVSAHTPCISLNITDASGLKGQGGVTSIGNSTNGTLYNLTLSGSNYIAGIGDHGEIIGSNYIQMGKTYDQYSGALRTHGFYNYYTKQFTNLSCPANATTSFTLTLPFNFTANMSISASPSNQYLPVTLINPIAGSTSVIINIQNQTAGALTANPTINISWFAS